MNRGQARIPIDQLRPGDRVDQVFLVAVRELRQTKAGKPYIQATVRLQGALGILNDRAVAHEVLADLAIAARPNEDVAPELKRLAKRADGGNKQLRRKLAAAWKAFRKVEPFW